MLKIDDLEQAAEVAAASKCSKTANSLKVSQIFVFSGYAHELYTSHESQSHLVDHIAPTANRALVHANNKLVGRNLIADNKRKTGTRFQSAIRKIYFE